MIYNSKNYINSARRINRKVIKTAMEQLGYKVNSILVNPNSCYCHRFKVENTEITYYKWSGEEKPPILDESYIYDFTTFEPLYDYEYSK